MRRARLAPWQDAALLAGVVFAGLVIGVAVSWPTPRDGGLSGELMRAAAVALVVFGLRWAAVVAYRRRTRGLPSLRRVDDPKQTAR